MCNDNLCGIYCGSLCSLLSLDLAGPRNDRIIRCLRIMILINCFTLIVFANTGFYFETNKHEKRIVVPWQVILALKILAAVSGVFQLVSIPFLIMWRKYLHRKRRELRMQEMVRQRNDDGSVFTLPQGRNPTSSSMFDHV